MSSTTSNSLNLDLTDDSSESSGHEICDPDPCGPDFNGAQESGSLVSSSYENVQQVDNDLDDPIPSTSAANQPVASTSRSSEPMLRFNRTSPPSDLEQRRNNGDIKRQRRSSVSSTSRRATSRVVPSSSVENNRCIPMRLRNTLTLVSLLACTPTNLAVADRVSSTPSAGELHCQHLEDENSREIGQSPPRPPIGYANGSTSSEPRTLALSSAERKRAERARRSRGSTNSIDSDQIIDPTVNTPTPASSAERVRRHRANKSSRSNQSDCSTLSAIRTSNVSINESISIRDPYDIDNWRAASSQFDKEFTQNSFGHTCDVCDRLWFRLDLRKVQQRHLTILEFVFGENSKTFMVCRTCQKSLNKNKLPPMSKSNGFAFPPKPVGLPELNAISLRLIAPRIPFMSIRRLQRDGYGIIGQVINMPVDVNSMIMQLPRSLDDDHVINVSIKRKLFHTSRYLGGLVKKQDLKVWLQYLVSTPLYRKHNVHIDWTAFNCSLQNENDEEIAQQNVEQSSEQVANSFIEDISEDANENVVLMSKQQTLLWNEANALDIAPGHHNHPLNLVYDEDAEELSFPNIYYGVARSFKVRTSPYMIANSEIRRTDRRAATPEKILYMAMKTLRIRVVDGIQNSFRRVAETEGITKRMLEDRDFMDQCLEKNFCFLKSIPNSAQYWKSRKNDLFAMLRQLGKPTVFMTLSASELQWPNLLKILHKLRNPNDDEIDDPMSLDRSTRSSLVNEDPVTCCLHFYKMLAVFKRLICSKKEWNPFGKNRVIDYFIRIEFQHRGSPHAHMLLWLDGDPREPVSENMPETIKLINNLCSVGRSDLNEGFYKNQVHRHTFTCTKRGESSCRFGLPLWPMRETCILMPLEKDDSRLRRFRSEAVSLKKKLENMVYESFDSFLDKNNLEYRHYKNIIRSTLHRPTCFLKREPSESMTNAFNPIIASLLNSNMDIQIILDEWSCAAYVVDYVNKSNRGTSNLHRELIKMIETHPELTQTQLYRKIGNKVLNSIEMSAQEAAWFLLRLNMSHSSRGTIYIPTCHPAERQKSHKTKEQMLELDPDSTDIWSENIIQKYENRPACLENVCLADFAASHTKKRQTTDGNEENDDPVDEYSCREFKRIIRYRNYDRSDIDNFKREMVMLYIPFRNEWVEILDQNRFISTYSANLDRISSKRREYEVMDIDQIIEELKQVECGIVDPQPGPARTYRQDNSRIGVLEVNQDSDDPRATPDRIDVISAIRTRENILPKDEYVKLMRSTNHKQREFILEFVHRLTLEAQDPIQVFLTGPAGCGKTYVLRLLMETVNRYSRQKNDRNNSYLACASTGKAAADIDGTTVHSAFQISTYGPSAAAASAETRRRIQDRFDGVECAIIDEISMVGLGLLHQVHQRLQDVTKQLDEPFGGLSIVTCGDLRQLPPVNQTPLYKADRKHLQGNLLWQSLDFFCLDQVMRQSDVVFSAILTKIGDGSPLTPGESQLIESRFRTSEWCDHNLTDVVRLFHTNAEVNSYNEKSMPDAVPHKAKDHITGYSSHEEVTLARAKLSRMSTADAGGLAYMFLLKKDCPYMITSNIDVEDYLVNGNIGTLRFHEPTECQGSSQDASGSLRVWLEFDDCKIGAKARLENSILYRDDIIQRHWTPINEKSVTINLGGRIRCRRSQLPLTPARAITIHKSQGGTFDRAVVSYCKTQRSNMVYVGLSRVKSLEGLFIVNSRSDFNFYHKNGSTHSGVREIRDEYQRLANHKLPTLRCRAMRFIEDSDINCRALIMSTINAQSLVAHHLDIETDEILSKSDIIVISESWMYEEPVMMEEFELLESSNSSSLVMDGSSGREARRVAGGVAIYKKKSTWKDYSISHSSVHQTSRNCAGDVATVILTVGRLKFALSGVYIHPKASKTNIEACLTQNLSELAHDRNLAMVVTGDFNCNVSRDNWIIDMMFDNFNLEYTRCDLPTTIHNTTIDLTLSRGVNLKCLPYVAYFTDHRPLLNKISIQNL